MRESFLQDSEPQTVDVLAERLAIRLHAHFLLAKVGRIFPRDDFERERHIAHIARHRTDVVDDGSMLITPV